MKKSFTFLAIILLILSAIGINAQKLKPGFDKNEYLEMLKLYAIQMKVPVNDTIQAYGKFKPIYRSKVMGMENRWDLCISSDSVAVINIRGTVPSSISWLENFYTAMIPAKGQIVLNDGFTFNYQLANNPHAAIHTGWLIATAYLSRDILPKIDSCYSSGIHDFIITGHSQGGAISYLMTSFLQQAQLQGQLATDIRFKTYCSAAPKPGNLYYAYDYEASTAGGWAFNIVNSADWVPEVPFSVQTMNDFNNTNPFKDVKTILGKQKFPKNLFMKYAYNQMNRPTKRALKRYQKYLGHMVSKYVKGHLPGFQEPVYYNSMNYTRAGAYVVLLADDAYYKKFPDNDKNIFTHHLLKPYAYLVKKLKE
jgi:hypothetical protein